MNNEDFNRKVLAFCVGLQDMYKDEDDREGFAMAKMELSEESLTEDFTAMIYAVYVTYGRITGDDVDIIGFTHIVNRLVFQKLMEQNKEKNDGKTL